MTEVSKASSLLRAERRPSEMVNELEARVAAVVRPFSLTLLRISLGIVFIWFGLLKVADATPVGDLVAGTLPWFDRAWVVPALGAVEVGTGELVQRMSGPRGDRARARRGRVA